MSRRRGTLGPILGLAALNVRHERVRQLADPRTAFSIPSAILAAAFSLQRKIGSEFVIGKTLAHFRVTDKLGEGGMGEVYRAEDSKLGRDVAIKMLPGAVAGDPERLARFEREAKVLAALNHPNIAGIYSLESAEETGDAGEGARSVNFLVMELAEGEDLADRIARGPIPVEKVLSIAFQIAEALEAAHQRGIIHRDLKPANIKADDEGRVKVLDFGLAKALDPTADLEGESLEGQRISASLSPTLTAQMTSAGVILGTAAYMSPEQAKGRTVDKRSDIWAFGLICFEMLTGKRLFAAESVAETLAGVIKTEVDFDDLPSDLAPSFRRLLRRCLERDPRRRLHDIADGRIVIEDIQSGTAEEIVSITQPPSESPAGWRRLLPYLVGTLGLAAALWTLSTTWIAEPPAPRSDTALQFGVHAPPQMELSSGFAISPDGEHLVFVARDEGGRTMLWLRRLDSVEARRLGGTTEARYPFWSPDSLQVGYFAHGQLQITDLISDSPRVLASTSTAVNVRGATWGADNTIVYAPSYTGPFLRISASGGEPEPATRMPDDGSLGTHRFPAFLPDGRQFVFYASSGGGTEPGALYLGELGSLETVELGPSSSRAVFAEPDHLLYVRGEALVAHRFDRASLKLEGEPVSLGVTLPGSLAVSGYRSLAISSTGLLVHRRETRGTTSLKVVNREGEEIELLPADSEAWQYAPPALPRWQATADRSLRGRQCTRRSLDSRSRTWHRLQIPHRERRRVATGLVARSTVDRLRFDTQLAAVRHLCGARGKTGRGASAGRDRIRPWGGLLDTRWPEPRV